MLNFKQYRYFEKEKRILLNTDNMHCCGESKYVYE